MADYIKTRKIRAYFPQSVIVEKPKTYSIKQYIHSEASGGFWCYMRDLSQSERSANSAAATVDTVMFYTGHNPKILAKWQDLYLEDEHGTLYRIKERPDEYDYRYGDMKFTGYKVKDETYYNEVRYDTD